MKIMYTTLSCALLLTTSSVWAETERNTQLQQGPIAPYGVNPNIFHVWAYKAQKGVMHGAEKVGEATEKGMQKIRPTAHQALDSAKSIGQQTAEQARRTGQRLNQSLSSKSSDSQQETTGQPVPMYQGNLSHPTSQSNPSSGVTLAPASTQNVQSPSSFDPLPAEEEIKVTKL